jgi:predicted membrane GTPase involved in stress response
MLLYLVGAKQGEIHEEMNVVDGVLVEVDLEGGVGRVTEEMVARAVGQRLQVVVFIGGVERVGKMEEVYERVSGIIKILNEIIAVFGGAAESLSIENGNVVLGSTKQAWAITSTPTSPSSLSSLLLLTP